MHLQLIVKGTRLCNLRCAYCHDWSVGRDKVMAFPVMAHLIANALKEKRHTKVTFIWHGGETTSLPIRFYEKALFLQSQFRQPGQEVSNGIQTNGTRLTPEWVQFFRENHFLVGISLDGPPELHDRYRRYASGQPSFADVAKGIELLKKYDLPFGILMVIDEGAVEIGADRIFDFFLQQGITDYALCAAKPLNQPDAPRGSSASHYVDPARMSRFLIRMYDRWCEHGNPAIRIRDLAELQKQICGKRSHLCTLAGKCFGDVFLIEPDGTIAHCDYFIGDFSYTVGNTLNDDFENSRRTAKMLLLQSENEERLRMLRSCEEFPICNGWCPHERYLSERHHVGHQAGCCGLRQLIAHIRANMHRAPKRDSSNEAIMH
jgi:uncharacterized protein